MEMLADIFNWLSLSLIIIGGIYCARGFLPTDMKLKSKPSIVAACLFSGVMVALPRILDVMS